MTTVVSDRVQSAQATSAPRALAGHKIRNLFEIMVASLDRHVFGQTQMVREVVQSILSGHILLIMGPSGIGKTHVVEKAMRLFGLKGETMPLNPEVTAEEITGFPVFDRTTGRMIHHEGPFGRGNQLVLLDEQKRQGSERPTLHPQQQRGCHRRSEIPSRSSLYGHHDHESPRS